MDEESKIGDEARLPMWAQNNMQNLRAELTRAYNDLAAEKLRLSEIVGNTPSTIKYSCGVMPGDLGIFTGIPSDAKVRFVLGKNHMAHIDCYLKKDGKNPVLEVYGGEPIAMKLRASNIIEINLQRG